MEADNRYTYTTYIIHDKYMKGSKIYLFYAMTICLFFFYPYDYAVYSMPIAYIVRVELYMFCTRTNKKKSNKKKGIETKNRM